MRPVCFVIPGDLSLPTGGYGYDRKVLAHAAAAGLDLRHVALPAGYPAPDAGVLAESARIIAATPANALLLIDGLAYGAMPQAMIRAFNRPVAELCHHPLALEPGLDAAVAARFRASETAAMQLARKIIVTSPLTGDILARDFVIARSKIAVALPGTEEAPRAKGSGGPGCRMIAVGSIIPRKAYDVMVRALETLKHLDWSLDIIGATAHAPATVDALRKQIQEAGLASRISLRGPMSDAQLDSAYAGADLFVMSSLFEGYGMVIAEALARGLPIVTSSGGAIADTMPDDAGYKVSPGSHEELAKAIHEMLASIEKRMAFSNGSWRRGLMLPKWDGTAREIAAAVKDVVP